MSVSPATLRSIPLFSQLSDKLLDVFAKQLVERKFAQGEIVVHEGKDGEAFYIIAEGEFQVYLRHDSLDFEKELSRLKPGQYFGEIAILSGHPNSASVRSLAPSRAWEVKRKSMLTLLEHFPEMGLSLCQRLAGMVAAANHEMSAIPLVSLRDFPRACEVQSILPPRVSLLCRAVAVDRHEKRIKVALVNPGDEGVRNFVRGVLNQSLLDVEFVAISPDEFEKARADWLAPAAEIAVTREALTDLRFLSSDGSEQTTAMTGDAAIFDGILGQAILAGASDIHIEPTPEGGRVRLRVDGSLFPKPELLTGRQHHQLISRIKVLSEMDIAIKRLPQDGHFSVRLQDRHIDARVSSVPCQGGEKLVVRILDPLQRRVDLRTLIPSRPVVAMLRDMFLQQSGMLLVCGPAGSGKTTTLYAGLNAIWNQSPTVNITTIEDPIEYRIDFAAQIGVNRSVNLDFPQILRTVLRQDPDIILVGEIRDEASATIAMEAATSGHQVLTSLHTDHAVESISRLRQLGAKSYMIAAGLHGVVCQKLVPRVCRHCAAAVPPEDPELKRLLQEGALEGTLAKAPMRGRGCEACQFRGEWDRVAVVELLVVDDAIRALIEENATAARIEQALNSRNFVSMGKFCRNVLEDGLVAPERIREIFPSKALMSA